MTKPTYDAVDLVHEAILTHGHVGSPGWWMERRQAERIVAALDAKGWLIDPRAVEREREKGSSSSGAAS